MPSQLRHRLLVHAAVEQGGDEVVTEGYRISNDVFDDYYYGDTIIKADIYDFDFIKILNKNVVLKLKDEFVNYYSQYAKLLVLSVEIDIDKIESLGYIYCGFAENSGLENFKVKEIYTIKDGQREEVKL